MEPQINLKNIVLVGKFNPTLFDKYFFIKNGVFLEDEINSESNFEITGMARVITSNVQLVVMGNQIIISGANEGVDHHVQQTAIKLLELTKGVELTAMGINFHWFLEEDGVGFKELTKKLFYSDGVSLFKNHFQTNDSFYGVYASKNFRDARLKLDAKPQTATDLKSNEDKKVVMFVFNFHFELSAATDPQFAINCINDYELYLNESSTIISNL